MFSIMCVFIFIYMFLFNSQVQSITSDHASTMFKVAKIMGIPFYGCFAHFLNLVIEKALKNIEDNGDEFKLIVEKCRSIVGTFNYSLNMNRELLEDQIKHNNKSKKHSKPVRLIQDIITRWNSLYYMLNRLLELAGSVARVFSFPANG
jgi:hypothetical protein